MNCTWVELAQMKIKMHGLVLCWRLEATWKEWDGVYLDNDGERENGGENENDGEASLAATQTTLPVLHRLQLSTTVQLHGE